MKENLQFLQSLVEDLNQTNSNNDKLATLKKAYAENPNMFAIWMSYIYDYDKKYFMTSANIQKCSELNNTNHYDNIWDLLNDLNDRKITGHEAIGTVRHFIEENSEYEDLIYKIIDKDLKIRVSGTTINKVHAGLVKEFSVALAEKLQDCVGKHTINLDTEDWYIQYKIDGCRCITVIDECGNISFYSRQGREILTLDNLKPEIQSLGLKNTCIDGEICIIDPTTGEVLYERGTVADADTANTIQNAAVPFVWIQTETKNTKVISNLMVDIDAYVENGAGREKIVLSGKLDCGDVTLSNMRRNKGVDKEAGGEENVPTGGVSKKTSSSVVNKEDGTYLIAFLHLYACQRRCSHLCISLIALFTPKGIKELCLCALYIGVFYEWLLVCSAICCIHKSAKHHTVDSITP